MEKLNEVRISFKHHGTAPHFDAINSAKVNVGNFFNENSELVFEVRFSQISLVDLVSLEEARVNLKQAMMLKNDNVESAIDKIAVAFNQIIDDYVDRKKDGHGRSMFNFVSDVDWSSIDGSDSLANVKEVCRDLDYGLGQVNERIKMIVLGFDYRKLLLFEALTARDFAELQVICST